MSVLSSSFSRITIFTEGREKNRDKDRYIHAGRETIQI